MLLQMWVWVLGKDGGRGSTAPEQSWGPSYGVTEATIKDASMHLLLKRSTGCGLKPTTQRHLG